MFANRPGVDELFMKLLRAGINRRLGQSSPRKVKLVMGDFDDDRPQ